MPDSIRIAQRIRFASSWLAYSKLQKPHAGSTFSVYGPLYGFDSETFASHCLTEDEYRCFSRFDEEDERDFGIRIADVEPPIWDDPDSKPFEYLGVY